MIIPSGQYGVIYADPPWQYQMWGEDGYEKSPDVHYGCMPLDEIKALRDQLLFTCAPNCVLFMWAVWPMLTEAMEVLSEWGFQYKTGGAWHKKTRHGKDAFGTGYIFRSASEPYLIGTLGSPKSKNKSTRNIFETCHLDNSVIEAQVREHSRKPDCTIDLIENLFEGPYLELFSRQKRAGWDSCGNQTDKFAEAT